MRRDKVPKRRLGALLNAFAAVVRHSVHREGLYRHSLNTRNATFCYPSATTSNKQKRPAQRQAADLFGCGDLQPDLEAPANQVIAEAPGLQRASSRFFVSPLDLDFDLLAESACCLNQRIQLDGNIAWIQYTI